MTELGEGEGRTWSDGECAVLNTLFATLIPEHAERGLPSGAQVGFLETCREPQTVAFLRAATALLEEWTFAGFITLAFSERVEHIRRLEREHLREFRDVVKQLLMRYYIDDFVVEAIGLDPRPPFPDGYAVPDGDLSLLEQVYEREPLHRSVPE